MDHAASLKDICDIIYEDEYLLAVAKPAGRLVIPGRNAAETPLIQFLAQRAGRKIFAVHRLDREASGIVLFAKDAATHRLLSRQFEMREVKKLYWTVVKGAVPGDGTVDRPIRQFGSGRMGIDGRGKPSVTCYRVKKHFSGATWLEVEPQTGRRHQIRVHLYSMGYPILGETRYGKDNPIGGAPRLMLHARELTFRASDGSTVTLGVPPPQDFLDVLATLGA